MSLRTRLLVALGAVALVALLAADLATYKSLQSFLLTRVDQQLQSAHIPIERYFDGPQNGQPTPVGGPVGNLQSVAPSIFVQLLSTSGTVLTTQPYLERGGSSSEPKLPATIAGFSQAKDPGGEPTTYFDAPSATSGGPSFRIRASVLDNGRVLVLGIPLSDLDATLNRLLIIELAVTGGALALAGLIGWWLVRLGLRPLATIERTAASFAGDEQGHRIPGESPKTEVGRLAGVLNHMLARIENAFAARDATLADLRKSEATLRRFVSDASHELRTPLAAVSAYAELFERGADQRPADLGRVMTGIRAETERMGHLVDDLLLLARMDEGRPLERVQVELVGLSAQAIEAAVTVGPQWPISLEAGEPVEVVGDPARLRQVLDNLLANVRAHTPAGTSTAVRISRTGTSASIEVQDNGPGIPDETADKLFERFYRVDQSRSRTSGGSGLGLSIVGAIVEAHGGSVSARPAPQGGSVFAVTLPVNGVQPI